MRWPCSDFIAAPADLGSWLSVYDIKVLYFTLHIKLICYFDRNCFGQES